MNDYRFVRLIYSLILFKFSIAYCFEHGHDETYTTAKSIFTTRIYELEWSRKNLEIKLRISNFRVKRLI